MTPLQAFDRYIATTEGMSYIESAEFARRNRDFFERIDAGEWFTVSRAAAHVGLPLDVFRHVFAHFLAALKLADVNPDQRVIH